MDTLNLILYPIIFILGYFFEFISSILGEYPLFAIILFAIFIGLMLKPLQKPLLEIEKKIAKKVNIINNEYKKLSSNLNNEEKFFLKEKIYKKYSYSPFHSILQAISFFALIPFLISVIIIFEQSSLINNSVVWGVELRNSDQLLFGLNILPIFMFLLTYVDSIYRYKNDEASKKRFIVISVILFFIIYNMSSALIIFWITMNAMSTLMHFYKRDDI